MRDPFPDIPLILCRVELDLHALIVYTRKSLSIWAPRGGYTSNLSLQ